MIGRRLGPYDIVEKLGEGGMGVVFKAHDSRLDRFVALKLIPAAKLGDADRVRRFAQEARTASALNHPNIVTIYDVVSEGDSQFLVMEFIRGKTLDQLIPRRGMRVNEILKIGAQMADALAAAHAAGIVHRDVKPGNVMVTDAGLVKVLDFGLAKLAAPPAGTPGEATATIAAQDAQPHTQDGAILGTVSYMSPEQAEGRPIDARSDIFSFGAVLYEMMTGQRAFRGNTKVSTLSAILRDEPAPAGQLNAEVPHELEKLVSRCLRKDPERRMQSMADVKIALLEMKEESESGKLLPGEAARLAPRRSRRTLGLAGAGALIVAMAAAAFWWKTSNPEMVEQKLVPLTSYPTHESDPALSPDGKQLAFAWDGEKSDNFDIYVKLVDAGTPVRLTTHPAEDRSPRWSPDGRFIAFYRAGPDGGYFVVPALGGAERKIAAQVETMTHVPPPGLDWSPDGKWLVIVDIAGGKANLSLVSPASGEKRLLLKAEPRSLGYFFPGFSPDGKWLACTRVPAVSVNDVYAVHVTQDLALAGTPLPVTRDRSRVWGHAWTPDSREIVFSSSREGGGTLFRVPVSGGQPRRVTGAGSNAFNPSIAGRKLVFEYSFTDLDIWRAPVAGGSAPQRAISSSRPENQADYSPDGSRVAFASSRSGSPEIWVSNADGSNPTQLTSFGGPGCNAPRWSPDGRQVAFASRPGGNVDIYIVDAQGGAPRRFTTDPAEDASARWSRDGKWIYFCSNRTGPRRELWKQPLDGNGPAVQVTHNGGWVSQESPDGRILYYAKLDLPGLWKMPVSGGPETRVLEYSPASQWQIAGSSIYFRDRDGRVRALDMSTEKVRDLSKLPPVEFGVALGLSVSPDEKWLLYAASGQAFDDIMMLENFQ